jgi:predicted small lipoprotein YifL
MRRTGLLWCALACCLLLAACGTKGDLVPADQPEAVQAQPEAQAEQGEGG